MAMSAVLSMSKTDCDDRSKLWGLHQFLRWDVITHYELPAWYNYVFPVSKQKVGSKWHLHSAGGRKTQSVI